MAICGCLYLPYTQNEAINTFCITLFNSKNLWVHRTTKVIIKSGVYAMAVIAGLLLAEGIYSLR